MDLDALDRQILEILRHDGRAPLSAIGGRIGLSAPAVKRRLDRLQEDGVITGFTAVIDDAKLGLTLEAFTELRFLGNTKVADIPAVASGLPEVKAVFTLAGDPDAGVWMHVRDTRHLTQTIDKLRRSGNVTGTKTLMVLETWEHGTAPAPRKDPRVNPAPPLSAAGVPIFGAGSRRRPAQRPAGGFPRRARGCNAWSPGRSRYR